MKSLKIIAKSEVFSPLFAK